MSKTVRQIASIAVAVGVFVATGSPTLAVTAYGVTSAATTALFAKSPRPDAVIGVVKAAIPPRVSGYGIYKTYGAQILYDTAADGFAVDVWAFHDGRIDAVEAYYLGDDLVTLTGSGFVVKGEDGRYGDNDTIQVKVNLGGSPGTAWPEVIAKLPGIWTTNHRGDGVVTGFMISKAVKAKNYQEVYPSGGPNQTPLGIVIRAQPVFDWRDGSQSLSDPLTWQWSENAILHLAHYQLVRNNKAWDRHFAPTLAYWTAAANDADVAMPLKGGGTEPRYRSCVSHKHTDQHKAVIGSLLACCDGWMAPRQDGALIVYSGRYYTPTVSIGPDEIAGYSWERGVDDENALNEIPVSYISAAHDYNVVDADAWVDESDIAARGAIRSSPLENQVPSHAQARRLAKRKLSQVMAPFRGTVTTTAAGGTVIGQRFIDLRLAEGEGTEHEFVVYDGPAEITQLRRNLQTGAVSFPWITADPNIDSWNAATEEGEPAPVGDRVAREPLDAPVITSASPTTGSNQLAGSAGARIVLNVTAPDRTDLTWFVRTRPNGSAIWNERQYSDISAGSSVTLVTEFVTFNSSVEVGAAYQVGDGRISPYSATYSVSVGAQFTDLQALLNQKASLAAIAGLADASSVNAALADIQSRLNALESPPPP